MSDLQKLIDARWSVRVGRKWDGSYYADAVPIVGEVGFGEEDWTRFIEATDIESPENALRILAAKAFDLVIQCPG